MRWDFCYFMLGPGAYGGVLLCQLITLLYSCGAYECKSLLLEPGNPGAVPFVAVRKLHSQISLQGYFRMILAS